MDHTAFLAFLYQNGYNPFDDDDVKDAIVEVTCDKAHFSDSELDDAVAVFRGAYCR